MFKLFKYTFKFKVICHVQNESCMYFLTEIDMHLETLITIFKKSG